MERRTTGRRIGKGRKKRGRTLEIMRGGCGGVGGGKETDAGVVSKKSRMERKLMEG